MIPKKYSSEAFVLARRNYSEADRILVLFTKHFGKISVLAKGVRKPKSRKRGFLEVFSRIKFAAAKGKSLDIITEVDIIDSYKELRKNLKKVAVAYFLVETIGRLTREEEKNLKLYNLVVSNLEKLEKSTSLRILREKFIFDTLVMLGFWPEGKVMKDPDNILEIVTEREMNSYRVGKKILQ